MDGLDTLKAKYLTAVAGASDESALEEVRLSALGKKGEISALMASLGKMDPDARKAAGANLNLLKDEIDAALRASLLPHFPELSKVHLVDYKVRILDGATATGAITRVLLDATNGDRSWTTIGVSANIIEASWNALEESLIYGLLHASA